MYARTQDHSAVLAQLDALKSADSGAMFAELIRAGLQALIEAEVTEVIGAGRYERADGRTPCTATGTDPRRCRRPPVMSRCRSPSCGQDRFSRRCWSAAAASTARCTR